MRYKIKRKTREFRVKFYYVNTVYIVSVVLPADNHRPLFDNQKHRNRISAHSFLDLIDSVMLLLAYRRFVQVAQQIEHQKARQQPNHAC